MPIPKALQDFLDFVSRGKPVYDPTAVREVYEATAKQFALQKTNIARVEDLRLALTDRSIPLRVYDPQPSQPKALIIYFHGGGHLSGSLETHDNFCRRLADTLQKAVLAVDYRLSPEHPYPAGLNDCIAVVKHKAQILKDFAINTQRLSLAGDSAGGNLACSVTEHFLRQKDHRVQQLLLLYPSLDYSMAYPSMARFAEGYLLTREKIAWYFQNYFSDEQQKKTASPMHFAHLVQFPACFIAAAQYDPLLDEAIAFSKKLQALRVDNQLMVIPGMVHGFVHFETLVNQQLDALLQQIKRWSLARNP